MMGESERIRQETYQWIRAWQAVLREALARVYGVSESDESDEPSE